MNDRLGICDLLIAISRMPEGPRGLTSRVWYESQKEHWMGWLFHYNGPGAYGRKVVEGRDARFVYNHVVCPDLLLYLATASGVEAAAIRRAKRAAATRGSLAAKAGAIRKELPWELVLGAMHRGGYLSKRVLRDSTG